jgi:hypothetical protein
LGSRASARATSPSPAPGPGWRQTTNISIEGAARSPFVRQRLQRGFKFTPVLTFGKSRNTSDKRCFECGWKPSIHLIDNESSPLLRQFVFERWVMKPEDYRETCTVTSDIHYEVREVDLLGRERGLADRVKSSRGVVDISDGSDWSRRQRTAPDEAPLAIAILPQESSLH